MLANGPAWTVAGVPSSVCIRFGLIASFIKTVIAPALITSGPQGVTGYAAGRPRVHPVFGYWPCLIEKQKVQPRVEIVQASAHAPRLPLAPEILRAAPEFLQMSQNHPRLAGGDGAEPRQQIGLPGVGGPWLWSRYIGTTPANGATFYGQDASYQGKQASYVDNGNSTVTDLNTGLTWQRSPDTDGSGMLDRSDKLTFDQAQALPAKLNAAKFGGFDDWRLPTIASCGRDGDASDPGESSPFVAGSMALQVAGNTGPVTITRDFWRMLRVLPGGKLIAFVDPYAYFDQMPTMPGMPPNPPVSVATLIQ